MSQQARKELEGVVVRRLTVGAGAAALGLAWYFTSSATSAAPIAFGAQPASDAGQPVVGIEQLDDHVFVRTVHVQGMRAPAGGVRAGTGAQGTTGQTTSGMAASGQATASITATEQTSSSTSSTTATSSMTSSAPIAQPVAAPAAAAPAAAPRPVATSGGSTPAK